MTTPQQEAFQSMATVFILENKTWIERGSGLVRFVFDLRTFALRLVIRPGRPDEFECKLRPRIRSKGPRAYVVRAQAENGSDEHILAVRFEREEDSRSFRRFVEKRDVDHNNVQKSTSQQISQYKHTAPPTNHFQDLSSHDPHLRNNTDYSAQHGMSNHHNNVRHATRSTSNIAHNNGNPYGDYGSNNVRNSNPMHIHYGSSNNMMQPQQPQQQLYRGSSAHKQTNHYSANPSPRQNMPSYPEKKRTASYKASSHDRKASRAQYENVAIIKLTSSNLEKHNKLFPPKRKQVKEVLLTKVILTNCVVAY